MDTRKTYTIGPEYKNCIYEVEHYSNTISTGKNATISITRNYRWGTFEITLTEDEKESLLTSDDILLNSYELSCTEMSGGCFESAILENETDYTDEEKMELLTTICDAKDDMVFDNCDIDFMNKNGWDLVDTDYSIVYGCYLEE